MLFGEPIERVQARSSPRSSDQAGEPGRDWLGDFCELRQLYGDGRTRAQRVMLLGTKLVDGRNQLVRQLGRALQLALYFARSGSGPGRGNARV